MNNEKLHKRIFYKSHRAHKKDRYKIFSLFSLCFHNNRTTSHTLTNFSTLVALRIRVVINTVVLFLSSHFEKERVGERERECVERREGIILLRVLMSEDGKRAKELQLDAKWEAAIDVSLRRIVYGAIGGTTLAMLMCRGTTARTAVAAFGIGIGVGSAYEDASKLFK